MFLNVLDLVEELTPLHFTSQSTEMSQAYESHMGRCLGGSSDVPILICLRAL